MPSAGRGSSGSSQPGSYRCEAYGVREPEDSSPIGRELDLIVREEFGGPVPREL